MNSLKTATAISLLFLALTTQALAEDLYERQARPDFAAVDKIVETAAPKLMGKYKLPGLSLAVTVDGQRRFYNYGNTAVAGGSPVTSDTIFEIGSISKTFTTVMAARAQAEGRLSLADNVSQRLPALGGGDFDRITLLNLATHTSGLPLFPPGGLKTRDQFLNYCADWRPAHPVGTSRVYSNPGIALLGLAAVEGGNGSFADLAEKQLFPDLGLTNTYIRVPPEMMPDYAQGHDKNGRPVRLTEDALAETAYAIRSSTADLIKYLEDYMGVGELLKPDLKRALDETLIGHYQVGGMIQALVWEYYPPGTDLKTILEGGSDAMVYQANPAAPLEPASGPMLEAVYNKTGSTRGFAAYAVFVPARKTGLVMLSNRPFPIEARVRLAFEILAALKAWPAE